ncbi:MAG: gas vesicle protein [Gallionella sp.]
MGGAEHEGVSLCELLDRVLNTGVVATGEIIISVAGIDLIYVNLQLLLTSVETARASDVALAQKV